jgi:hypothetical protein
MRIPISGKSIRLARLLHRELPLDPFGVMPKSLRKPTPRERSSPEKEKPKAKPLA